MAEQAFPPGARHLLLAGVDAGVREFIHSGGVLRGLLFVEKEVSTPGYATGSWQNLTGVENVPWPREPGGRGYAGKAPDYLQSSPQKARAEQGLTPSALRLAFPVTCSGWSGSLSSVSAMTVSAPHRPGKQTLWH